MIWIPVLFLSAKGQSQDLVSNQLDKSPTLEKSKIASAKADNCSEVSCDKLSSID
jgi:hypothetical protein